MAITLYHCVSARSFRPLWALEELGLSYQLVMLPFPPRVHAKHYLEINPLGTVPTFFDDDMRMTESAGICHYLASRYGPAQFDVRPEEAGYGAYLNWLHFGEATLTFPQTIVLRYGSFEPPERQLPQAVEDYTRWFLARLRSVETAMTKASYLCADRFTMADISVGYALMLGDWIGIASRFTPGIADYWRRLQERPAFQAALDVETQAAVAQNVPATPSPCIVP